MFFTQEEKWISIVVREVNLRQTSILLKRVVMVFKTATLVYKFLHTGFPMYLAPYLSSYTSSYSTRRSQRGGNFLVIPKFYSSVHKSIKQFGNSFAFDAPTVWNALPDENRASPSLASFRKQLKTYLYTKAYPS